MAESILQLNCGLDRLWQNLAKLQLFCGDKTQTGIGVELRKRRVGLGLG